MNRPLKFRAWDGKRMIYDGQSEIIKPSCLEGYENKYFSPPIVTNKGVSMYFYETRLPHATSEHFDHLTGIKVESLMQYTGLKDKTGREIFEGDILGLEDPEDMSKCIIEFHNGSFKKRFLGFSDNITVHWSNSDFGLWVVVGHIFEKEAGK